jgi:mono/diheme cytochrome c family protein
MRVLITCMAVGIAFLASVACAETPPASAPDGKALYHEKCSMCHDKMGMGTGLLSRRMKVAEFRERADLNPALIVAAARAGIGNMPAIPRGEVSDRELQAIASYLAQPPEAKK